MHGASNIFGHLALTIGGFAVSLNYPILNFKKTVCPKKPSRCGTGNVMAKVNDKGDVS